MSEPTDRAKRLAAIEARPAPNSDTYRDKAWLLREIREADAALAALGVTGEWTLAERIGTLGAKPTPCDHTRFPLATDAGTYCTDCGEDVPMPPPEPDIEPAVGD